MVHILSRSFQPACLCQPAQQEHILITLDNTKCKMSDYRDAQLQHAIAMRANMSTATNSFYISLFIEQYLLIRPLISQAALSKRMYEALPSPDRRSVTHEPPIPTAARNHRKNAAQYSDRNHRPKSAIPTNSYAHAIDAFCRFSGAARNSHMLCRRGNVPYFPAQSTFAH